MGEKISSYRDLIVYQKAFELQQEIFKATKKFPKDETYSLVDQVRRSSRSIGANIAEGWQKRRYPAHFVSKLTDSSAEQAETEHWIYSAQACSYITAASCQSFIDRCAEIGKMLGAMINSPDKWCS